MSGKLTVTDLITLPLFHGEAPQALEWLLDSATECWYQPGDVLLQPGERNDRLAVILSGEMRVEIEAEGHAAITRLGPGECVGELSVLDGKPVAAYVIAESRCRVLLFGREAVWRLIDHSHAVARNMLHILVSRVRNDNSKLSASILQQRHDERSARTDVLTGLNNRRWLEEMLPRIMERCRIDGAPLALLMLDIDHFKRFNDEHGHLAGDRALAMVGRCLRENLRPSDAAVRFGGEEFIVILPQIAGKQMLAFAERNRTRLRAEPIVTESGEPLSSITVSIGVAQWQVGQEVDGWIAAADAALYQAKAAGRDRVVVSKA